CRRTNHDVSSSIRPIWSHAGTRDPVPARGAGMGRTHRFGSCSSAELAALGLLGCVIWQSARGTVTPWVVEVNKLGEARAVSPATVDYQPTDPQIEWHLARFIEDVRSLPMDPVIVRVNWLRAYDFVTGRGATALNDYARVKDPFAQIGKIEVAVDISSVLRASTGSFRVAWVERRYENASLEQPNGGLRFSRSSWNPRAMPNGCGKTHLVCLLTPLTGRRSLGD